MVNLIVFGSVWFWILFAVTLSSIIWFLESSLHDYREDNGGGVKVTFVLGTFLLLYYLFGSKEHVTSAFEFIRDHPIKLLGWMALYLFLGVVWGFIKWYFFLLKRKDHIFKYDKNLNLKIPNAAENKNRILTWMNYWVFSLLWTILDEPVKRFFNFIFRRVEGLFNKMSNSIFMNTNSKSNI